MTALAQPKLDLAGHFFRQAGEKSLLRFSTAGSVDDGKSTLIGRLLHDTRGAYEDQIEAVKKSKINRAGAGQIDFSLLTDGLKAEREQGITIDVAYRYFSTARRKFIIADTPGHEQYTRNMATGASNAEVAIILVDARKGLQPQSRRHAFISALLGIRHLVIAVNKMDLVDWDLVVFEQIREQFLQLAPRLRQARVHFIPVSALLGDNVVERSPNMPWYRGPALLEFLEEIEVDAAQADAPFRFPVQMVIRPDLDFRGFAGQIASGRVRVGDEIEVNPSGRRSRVERIVTFDGDLAEAVAPMSVTLTLEDELDVSRGNVLTLAQSTAPAGRFFSTTLVWMSETPLEIGKAFRLRHGPFEVTARVTRLAARTDIATLTDEPAPGLVLNEIGTVSIETTQPLAFDPYETNRVTGGLVLIDPITNLTVAAGLIESAEDDPAAAARRAKRHDFRLSEVTPADRRLRYGHAGALIAIDPASTLAKELEAHLFHHGAHVIRFAEPITQLDILVRQGLLVLAHSNDADIDLRAASSLEQALAQLAAARIWRTSENFVEGEGI